MAQAVNGDLVRASSRGDKEYLFHCPSGLSFFGESSGSWVAVNRFEIERRAADRIRARAHTHTYPPASATAKPLLPRDAILVRNVDPGHKTHGRLRSLFRIEPDRRDLDSVSPWGERVRRSKWARGTKWLVPRDRPTIDHSRKASAHVGISRWCLFDSSSGSVTSLSGVNGETFAGHSSLDLGKTAGKCGKDDEKSGES